jgi:hypothetical protein
MIEKMYNQFPRKRFEWLAAVIRSRKYTIGAEIGCDCGETTRYLLALHLHLKLYGVDIWQRKTVKEYRGTKINREYVYFDDPEYAIKKFNERTAPFKDRLTILLGCSWEMGKNVTDNSLDFVFIDADHHYEPVKRDIIAWAPKLKPGGMISGHDIHINTVLQAVQELIPDFKLVGVDHCWEAKKEDVKI